ncbi:ATP-dependent 6-phosphofructokinase [Cryptosporangium phraense]|uniref:ATP-dependent 6-phosphofructokinase n=1 Tax=Cryptosporangium phraense TaxID=2593070 RepID=A0A545AQB5_9ACTN|nr:ATP-dependent 6-phosphofructokinase [Cryptosporangium phraense]TQS42925.1 ATP-dependent 6-phosphofructokinase [Cryptosporangium phraense]
MQLSDLQAITHEDLLITRLGQRTVDTPLQDLLGNRQESVHYVTETDRVLVDDTLGIAKNRVTHTADLPAFNPGGPRAKLFFDPSEVTAAIVTCGGLCPGLNNVIRALVLHLKHAYGCRDVLGFKNGYQGLADGSDPVRLTPDLVRDIHNRGGTILGTSRGNQDPATMIDTLVRHKVDMLFVVGGDGTLRGAARLAAEANRRGLPIAVVGVPKTIDNDIPWIDHSFGFQTAYARAAESITAAHVEASSGVNGIGLVKLMGRHSGFIAAHATLVAQGVDFTLIPEVPFTLDGLLAGVRKKLADQGHAVVVVAEGAGQNLLPASTATDPSGNRKLGDVGAFLRGALTDGLSDLPFSLRYIDPGYAIRSVPANAFDAVYCTRLAQAATHAAMAGFTSMMVGSRRGRFINMPIKLATATSNHVDPYGDLWMAVLETTGQPLTL